MDVDQYNLTDENSLMRFRYTSSPVADISPKDFVRIQDVSARRNAAFGVTGKLQYDGSRFFQEIEGGTAPISLLVGVILADPRHNEISIEMLRRVEARTHSTFVADGFRPRGLSAVEEL